MLARGSGQIVSVGSIAGRQALPHNGAYSASKFGLRGLHEVLDTELRGTGVRSTLVEPAATDTPLWDAIDRERFTGLPERAAMLSAADVADAVAYVLTRSPRTHINYLGLERS
jgi:NADP-dependent 3-hydroxy acid dehydrogenase YdfG